MSDLLDLPRFFSEALNHYIEKEEEAKKEDDSGANKNWNPHWRISALPYAIKDGGCLLSLTEEPTADYTSVGQNMMFTHGNVLHLLYQSVVHALVRDHEVDLSSYVDEDEWGEGFHVGSETLVNLQITGLPDLPGHADLIIGNDEAPMVVVDFKTVRGNAFRYGFPKPSNVLQVQAYMMAVDVKVGYLIYIDREGQNGFHICRVDRDDQAVMDAAHKLHDAIMAYDIPDEQKPKITVMKTKIKVEPCWQMNYCRLGNDCMCKQKYFPDTQVSVDIAKVNGDEATALPGFEDMQEEIDSMMIEKTISELAGT